MRHISMALGAALLTALLSGCAGSKPFLGTWKSDREQCILSADGTGFWTEGYGDSQIRWEEKDGVLTIQGYPLRWKVGDDQKSLTLTHIMPNGEAGETYIYTRP